MIILDTDIMIDILRKYKNAIEWLKSIENEQIILPGFVIVELLQGCKNKEEQNELKKDLNTYQVDWPSKNICNRALEIFMKYHLSHGIGIIDVFIGQMALEMKVPLYTFNEKHYSVIKNLTIVQPYKKSNVN